MTGTGSRSTLEEGKTYRFHLMGSPTHHGTLGDPYLRGIYDEDGELIDGTANRRRRLAQQQPC